MSNQIKPTEDIDDLWPVDYLRLERTSENGVYLAGYNDDGPDYRFWPTCTDDGLYISTEIRTEEYRSGHTASEHGVVPIVEGTEVPDVYSAHAEDELDPEEVAEELGMTLAGVYMALHQYHQQSDKFQNLGEKRPVEWKFDLYDTVRLDGAEWTIQDMLESITGNLVYQLESEDETCLLSKARVEADADPVTES